MCLINFHFQKHPNYKLVVAANRDEFYARPTHRAHFWPDAPFLLAGRDLVQKGTWLGITKEGRFAALTNIRDLSLEGNDKKSRGEIVSRFLKEIISPEDYLKKIRENRKQYAGFNILLSDGQALFHYNNVEDKVSELDPGTYSLSNDTLNTPWPKVVRGKKELEAYIKSREILEPNALFEILENKEIAPDAELPSTGVEIELERSLSASFIKTPEYGTRAATVLLVDHHNQVTFIERTYKKGLLDDEKSFQFNLSLEGNNNNQCL